MRDVEWVRIVLEYPRWPILLEDEHSPNILTHAIPSLDILKVLLEQQACKKLLEKEDFYSGNTPLLVAAKSNQTNALMSLLEAGCNPNKTNHNCETAYDLAPQGECKNILGRLMGNTFAIVGNLGPSRDCTQCTTFEAAIDADHPICVDLFLSRHSVQVKEPVSYAVKKNKPQCLRVLLTDCRYAQVIKKFDGSSTLLHDIIMGVDCFLPIPARAKLLRVILESPYCTREVLAIGNYQGYTLLHHASYYGSQFVQAVLDSKECTARLLATHDKGGLTPLNVACRRETSDSHKVVELLVKDPRCDLLTPNGMNKTPLWYAQTRPKCKQLLEDALRLRGQFELATQPTPPFRSQKETNFFSSIMSLPPSVPQLGSSKHARDNGDETTASPRPKKK